MKLPYCPECGEEISEDARFCPECGVEVGVKARKTPKEPTQSRAKVPKRSSPRRGGISKGIIVVAIAIVAVVAAIGAYFLFFQGGASFESPEATARTYINALDSGNADLAYRCLSSDQQKNISKPWFDNMLGMWDKFNLDVNLVDVSNVNISGNTATANVKIKITGKNPTTGDQMSHQSTIETPFVEEDGKWKIDEFTQLM